MKTQSACGIVCVESVCWLLCVFTFDTPSQAQTLTQTQTQTQTQT